MRALGLDLGQKRVGVATSDSAGTLAMPIEVVALDVVIDNAEHQAIADLVEEWEAEIVVVDACTACVMDGSVGPMAREVRIRGKGVG